ncbi:MAG: hypothetical protein E7536_07300 [Ruminococcaceae bacterium]|nr:hypothetical protein [Oscillospiraceae bacterium]
MGLFDFLKKNSAVQTSLKSRQNETKIQTCTKEVQKLSCSQKEVIIPRAQIKNTVEIEGPPLLSDLIKTATPSRQGLYPHEIMMLEYAPCFKKSNNTFQQFWYYQYSVTEPQSLLESLYNRGFIEVGDLQSALDKLKISEIKDELKLLNLKVTGKKEELINRLFENGDVDYLNKKYKERYFVLTPKGEQELKENKYISYLHRNRYMSVWEMNEKIAQTHYPYRDILWGYFNEQSDKHFQNCDFGLYRNIRLNMHDFLCEEEKYKPAFHLLAEVISYDLSGLGNGYKFILDNKIEKDICLESRLVNFFTSGDEVTLPPGIIKCFESLKAKFDLSDDEFISYVYKEFSEIHIYDRVFNADECANIILSEIGLEKCKIKDSYKVAEQRIRKMSVL